MKVVAGEGRQAPLASSVVLVACMSVLAATAVSGVGIRYAAPAAALVVVFVAAHRVLLTWPALLTLIVATILFVPIKRYTLPANLPFNLELYRLVVAVVVLIWLAALLIDPRVRLRKSGLEAPIFFVLVVILLSLIANRERSLQLEPTVIKAFTFFVSYILVFYLVVSVVRRARDIDYLVQVLVVGGAILGIFALIESATGYNAFNHLRKVLPILHYDPHLAPAIARGGRLRVYASAQHPIAFSAVMTMLIPLAIYRARAAAQKRWWVAAALITLGVLATRSRTGILMLGVVVLVYVFLRPAAVKRLWPAIIPALVVIHIALPGTLGSIKESFFPKTGFISQVSGTHVGSGRLTTLGPALDSEFKPNPMLGEGFGSRITARFVPGQPHPNGPILDDGWLGILLETGVIGTFGFLWIFLRSIGRMGGASKDDPSARGWLLAATTAGVAAYAVGMFTYDALSFIQVTFCLFIILGIGFAALLSKPAEWAELSAAKS